MKVPVHTPMTTQTVGSTASQQSNVELGLLQLPGNREAVLTQLRRVVAGFPQRQQGFEPGPPCCSLVRLSRLIPSPLLASSDDVRV
jgi:hypothetical protein